MELDPFNILIASCLSLRDPLCKALHHSRFPHTRRANEASVVPWVTRLEIIISGFNMNWKYLEISNQITIELLLSQDLYDYLFEAQLALPKQDLNDALHLLFPAWELG